MPITTRKMRRVLDGFVERDKALNIDPVRGSTFPEEIMFCVAEYLERKEIVRLRVVCRAFNRAAKLRLASEIKTPDALTPKLRKRYKQLCQPEHTSRIKVMEATIAWYSDQDRRLICQILALASNLVTMSVNLPRMVSDPIESGIWDGCFQNVTTFNLTAPAASLKKFHLEEIFIPRLTRFKYQGQWSWQWSPIALSNEETMEIILAPFLNRHSAHLRNMELFFDPCIGDVSGFAAKLKTFPKLEVLRMTGKWRNPDDADDELYRALTGPEVEEYKHLDYALQTFVQKHVEQLKELHIAPTNVQSKSELIPKLFNTIPETRLPITSLKIGVWFDAGTTFIPWLGSIIGQLQTLWIAKPRLFEHDPVFETFLSLAKDASQPLQLKDLLIHSGPLTKNNLTLLKAAFPKLHFLRLNFSIAVGVAEIKHDHNETMKEHSSAASSTFSAANVSTLSTPWPSHLFAVHQSITDKSGFAHLALTYHVHLEEEKCECSCRECNTGDWPMGFD